MFLAMCLSFSVFALYGCQTLLNGCHAASDLLHEFDHVVAVLVCCDAFKRVVLKVRGLLLHFHDAGIQGIVLLWNRGLVGNLDVFLK